MKRRGLPRISLGGVLLAFPFSWFSFSQVLTRLNSEGVPVPVPVPVSLLNLVPVLFHGSHLGLRHTVSNMGETMKNMGGTRSASNSGSNG